jgi:hypothetical protein
VKSLIIFQFFTHYAGLAASERQSVLDPSQHPQSEIYQPIFSEKIQPLDNKLSWTKRFNGDETFNTSETLLNLNSTEAAKSGPSTAMEPESMTGMKMDEQGQFGPIEMGGMFTVLKIRADQKPNDYSDPGWYDYPAGTVAYEAELS